MSDKRSQASWVLCLLVIIASFCQVSLGAEYSKTGEQLTGGLPLSTLCLFICGLALILLNFKKDEPVGICWPHALFIIVLSASLLGLPATSRNLGIKELIQIYEIFVFAYLVFLINRKLLLEVLQKTALPIALFFLILHCCQLNKGAPFYLSDSKLEAFIVLLMPFIILNTAGFTTAKRMGFLSILAILSGLSFSNGGLLLSLMMIALLSGLLLTKSRKELPVYLVLVLVCSFIPFAPSSWGSLNPNYDNTHKKRLYIEYSAVTEAPNHFPLGIGPGRYKSGINYLKQMQADIPHENDL
ncbi:MAG: hypothetical protein HRT89_05565, partial [Lentisphaeria bacterium]|nr:hypothetical protein [Lentisphaeria bacterium]